MESKLTIHVEALILLISCFLLSVGASNSGFNPSLDASLMAAPLNQTNSKVSCPSGWSANPSNTKCFKYTASNESWDESEKQCSSYSGHLAAVTSLEELILLKKLCSENSNGCWVGGRGISENWKWTDNTSYWNSSIVPRIQTLSGCTNQSCFSSNLTDLCTLVINRTASLVAQRCNMSHAFLCMLDMEDTNVLRSEILKDEAVSRLIELGKVSDAEEFLERTFQSPASVRAGSLIRTWMEDAGLHTWVDQMGNVHGRYEGLHPSEKALLIGSHLDTVIDAGKFDGALGIITAISALKVLNIRGMLGKLRRPVEVIAFSDEEGVRFQSTFLGSGAIAGVLPVSTLHVHDKSGVTVQGALRKNFIEITEESLLQLKYDPESVFGYIEVHIEQGPVLEAVGLPLGLVKGIAGQTRLRVTVKGSQGHAGTVPMNMRQDPMAAAAELIVLLESLCKQPEDYLSYDGQCASSTVQSLAGSLVCTVGEISTWPSASNVIPGQATFTVDIRAMDDLGREAIIYELSNRMHRICDKRSVLCFIERKHDANAVVCDPGLSSQLKSATYDALKRISGEDVADVPILMSGAGQDAMAMSHLTKVAMLFVRCRGGISHSPAEHVSDDDVLAAGMAVVAFLETLI